MAGPKTHTSFTQSARRKTKPVGNGIKHDPCRHVAQLVRSNPRCCGPIPGGRPGRSQECRCGLMASYSSEGFPGRNDKVGNVQVVIGVSV